MTTIEWRAPKKGRKVFVVDQIINDADPETWTIYYYMSRQPTSIHEFRVPKDNQQFIEDAITSGCLKLGVAYYITVESDGNRRCRWIKITAV